MSASAVNFVSDLCGLRFDHAFNPYADVCETHDLPEADAIRRDNLEAAMTHALHGGISSLWIARDLGYRGGRRTGLALTDERHLQDHADHLGVGRFRKATRSGVLREATAGVVWPVIRRTSERVFLWNVFPLHPHPAADAFGNRKHTSEEAAAGLDFVHRLVTLFQPRRVIAIGQDADGLLAKAGIAATGVRHPSHGGASVFRGQMATLYGLADATGKL